MSSTRWNCPKLKNAISESRGNAMKKSYTKMTAEELARATAQYDRPVDRKATRPLSAAEKSMGKKGARGPGRPKIGKGSVNVLISFELGLLARANEWAKSQ